MAQKVHPKAFRLGVNRKWDARWFARGAQFRKTLQEDVKIRAYLVKKLREALIDRIEMERSRGALTIVITSGKPGFVIGRSGSGIEELTREIKKRFFRGRRVDINISVKEMQRVSLSANIVATQIALDIEKRMPFRRVMKQSLERVMKANAKGVKVSVAGRLNGADIARTEKLSKGKIPLHNLRSDIDFATARAWTTYGVIGIKVWINRGEVFADKAEK